MPRTHYRCLVKAFNRGGGSTTVMSDGFTVDGTPPALGAVVDGLDSHVEVDFVVRDEQALSASWHGFNDEEFGRAAG